MASLADLAAIQKLIWWERVAFLGVMLLMVGPFAGIVADHFDPHDQSPLRWFSYVVNFTGIAIFIGSVFKRMPLYRHAAVKEWNGFPAQRLFNRWLPVIALGTVAGGQFIVALLVLLGGLKLSYLDAATVAWCISVWIGSSIVILAPRSA